MTLTLQGVAGGRFMLGVGSGWLEEEFDALGVPFAERGARFDETLAVLRAAWAGGELEGAGPHYPFARVLVTAEPVRVPLILGGNTDRALRRTARLADGWFSSGNPTFDEARAAARSGCGELGDEVGRERAAADLRAHGRSRSATRWPATPSTASSTSPCGRTSCGPTTASWRRSGSGSSRRRPRCFRLDT